MSLIVRPMHKRTTRRQRSEAGIRCHGEQASGENQSPFAERIQRDIGVSRGNTPEVSLGCLHKVTWYEEGMSNTHTTPPSKYPAWRGILGAVANKCGPDVALALLENLPGVRFYVPAKYTDAGPLSKLRKAHAEAIISEFAKEIIYIPIPLTHRGTYEQNLIKKQALLDAIEAQVVEGACTQEIARNLGISQNYVFMLRREFGAEKISAIRKRQKASQTATVEA